MMSKDIWQMSIACRWALITPPLDSFLFIPRASKLNPNRAIPFREATNRGRMQKLRSKEEKKGAPREG